MKNKARVILAVFAGVLLASLFSIGARAQCGASDGHLAANAASSLLMRSPAPATAQQATATVAATVQSQSANSIVGFWHVKFVSKGTTGIPDGAVIDQGFSQWHQDGTEILNSSRPPATSNFCLGVWEKTGDHSYKLNHFALSSDLNGNMIGPANIRENVTLSASGNSYSGTFSIDQYDTAGNLLIHIQGTVSATRITPDTKASEIF
jgi:hypothetical protein